jgi:cytosine/uracil/thiamine/allantoin permease
MTALQIFCFFKMQARDKVFNDDLQPVYIQNRKYTMLRNIALYMADKKLNKVIAHTNSGT